MRGAPTAHPARARHPGDDRLLRLGPAAARPRGGGLAGFRARRGQRGRGGPDLPGPRRDAAGDRAGRGLAPHADAGPARRALGRQVRAADRGQPDGAAPAQDAPGGGRLELGPAVGVRAGAGAQAGRLPRGATLAAAEYVCADELLPQAAVLPALSGLVDKSILGVAEGQDGMSPRYRMLETVRAYGLERLAEAGAAAAVRDAFPPYSP